MASDGTHTTYGMRNTTMVFHCIFPWLAFFFTTDLSARWLTIQPSSFSAVVRSPFFGMYWKYTSV